MIGIRLATSRLTTLEFRRMRHLRTSRLLVVPDQYTIEESKRRDLLTSRSYRKKQIYRTL
jgi:hypothetical protein